MGVRTWNEGYSEVERQRYDCLTRGMSTRAAIPILQELPRVALGIGMHATVEGRSTAWTDEIAVTMSSFEKIETAIFQ